MPAGRCCLYCVMVVRPPWRAVLGVNCPAAHKAAGFQRVLHIGVVGVGIGAQRHPLLQTPVDAEFPDADTFFPTINPDEWEECAVEHHEADDRNPLPYTFLTLKRKR